MKPKPHILPIIIFSQFACTSLWFSGNAVVDELAAKTGFGNEIIGYILSSVQLGFIVGTLTFALFMVADRFSPSKVFLVCAFLGALCNLTLLLENNSKALLLISRFATGFFLAGIYPVGMKIAADYYERGLGRALGFLVGALVFGKSFPYLIKAMQWGDDYTMVIKSASATAVFGGVLLWSLVPDGPFRKPSLRLQLQSGPRLFRNTGFRKAALGYFGHMWELYAFWAFIPFTLAAYNTLGNHSISIPLWTAITIALGGFSCILGGYLSLRYGSKKVAVIALFLSGLCCLLSPLLFQFPTMIFLIAFCIWGMAVTADSPQFSSLVASSIAPELKGTGLTLVNCIGFAISIVSIELLSVLANSIQPNYIFIVLAIGPALGLWQLFNKSN
ncbi:MFS transporter [Maribacter halichondriae]|uniref:MFS transporter n=1 Tax=Maribacter halichondriae TaxID=2980554 RepID=UPI0023588DD0|nr:MFS transporter [Maribacter sp. Hal144]